MKHRIHRSLMVATALLGLWATGKADNDFHWRWPTLLLSNSTNEDMLLTDNNGARALAFGTRVAYGVPLEYAEVVFSIGGHARAARLYRGSSPMEEQPNTPFCGGKVCIAGTFGADVPQKHAFWPNTGDLKVEYADTFLTAIIPSPTPWADVEEWDAPMNYMDDVAIAATRDGSTDYVYVCYFDDPDGDDPPGVYVKVTANRGYSWSDQHLVMEEGDDNQIGNFSLAAGVSGTQYLIPLT
jgi:hypothetical protein